MTCEKNSRGKGPRCKSSTRPRRKPYENSSRRSARKIVERLKDKKNVHIEQLMASHEKAFAEIKNYYNDITHNNLDLIKSLKEEVADVRRREIAETVRSRRFEVLQAPFTSLDGVAIWWTAHRHAASRGIRGPRSCRWRLHEAPPRRHRRIPAVPWSS